MGATLNWIIIIILQQTAASYISEMMKSRRIFTDLLLYFTKCLLHCLKLHAIIVYLITIGDISNYLMCINTMHVVK